MHVEIFLDETQNFNFVISDLMSKTKNICSFKPTKSYTSHTFLYGISVCRVKYHHIKFNQNRTPKGVFYFYFCFYHNKISIPILGLEVYFYYHVTTKSSASPSISFLLTRAYRCTATKWSKTVCFFKPTKPMLFKPTNLKCEHTHIFYFFIFY